MPRAKTIHEHRQPGRVGLQAAADHAGVSTRTIRRWIASGELPAYRIGPKLIKVDLDAVDAMLKPIGGHV